MQDYIGWVPLLPFIGFVLLAGAALFRKQEIPETLSAIIGAGSVGLAALLVALIGREFLANGAEPFTVTAWQWIDTGGLQAGFSFYIDGLTLVMLGVITGVGFLIHLYSAGYMRGDDGYRRYFSYLNLFVSAMLILVMADNLALLYLGWEGVGLCSYLLIGFWYKDAANGAAARKAFIVTRVGDTAMAIGLCVLFMHFGTLDIQQINGEAGAPGVDAGIATLAALLLLGGAVGKSAQMPLQTWLPDAMAGPTPVSALIHAATMVTAGVYLIARTHPLFEASEFAMMAVATVGALTLFIAGCSALVQSDIKRILAYSTISQIGYMFFALGVGAWSAGIFHLVTHAFFKALLFLAAGSVILSLHHEQDIFRMGGLRKKMPVTFLSFVIGCACLAALPFTSGFYSKDAILLQAWNHFGGLHWLWLLGTLGAIVTGVYSFRLLLLVFFGKEGSASKHCNDANTAIMSGPLLVLCTLALAGGLLTLPLAGVFTTDPAQTGQLVINHTAEIIAIAAPLIGLAIALFAFRKGWFAENAGSKTWFGKQLAPWWRNGWGFDAAYDALLVRPFTGLAGLNKSDIVDSFYKFTIQVSQVLHRQLSATQTGQLRWYAMTMVAGSIFILALVALL
ncbi:NADH-quinone oxidoreductase subunit L [Biformimicrobium ophioploci]|uniref:NADH-quinone oxidoreductase subunit L n=1 Tax=Biformimicrobium ophioploci TaxID=3036711 RepID=A0ABQ6LX88_9GAMM|nr:NADH-quinone oxidoreductase subunit L [Microbulbifer sp. NKW57]GMG86678.1 NADH-quinone oxidoreductase subunit L [Microbulbifer sp. NKW57]